MMWVISTIFLLRLAVAVTGVTEITLNQETYTETETLIVTFNNAGEVTARDRLALYSSSEVEGRYAESIPLMWIYACGSQTCNTPTASGRGILSADTPMPEAFVSWPLPAGTYRIVMLANGGQKIIGRSPEITFLGSAAERPRMTSGRPDDAASAPAFRRRQSASGVLGGPNDPDATDLSACWGECDSDAQCKEGLKCFQRTGFTPVPGCEGRGCRDCDYCYDPTGSIELSGGNDSNPRNLEACTGECDSDDQCAAGLRCFQRDNGETIPGCTGSGADPSWDYCYDPNWTAGNKCFLMDALYPAKLPSNQGASSPEACQQICAERSECEFWTYNPSNRFCFLNNGAGGAGGFEKTPAAVGLVSGPKRGCHEEPLALDCGAPACSYYYHDKQAYKTEQDRAALGEPDRALQLVDLKTTEDYRDNYVVKVEAWIKAPSSGDYIFYTSSDDDSQVFVSREPRTKQNLVKVVELTDCCRRVTGTTTVNFIAGEFYYLVGYMREGQGGDYFEIGFKGPGVDETRIGGKNVLQTPPINCFEQNIDYTGNDIGTVSADSAKTCQDQCQENAACDFWTWHPDNGCHLKNSKAGRKVAARFISGAKFCGVTPATQDSCFEQDIDYQGHDYLQLHTSSAENCQDRCRTDDSGKCLFWTWNSDGTCYLKEESSGREVQTPLVSGPKFCGQPGGCGWLERHACTGDRFSDVNLSRSDCAQRCLETDGCSCVTWLHREKVNKCRLEIGIPTFRNDNRFSALEMTSYRACQATSTAIAPPAPATSSPTSSPTSAPITAPTPSPVHPDGPVAPFVESDFETCGNTASDLTGAKCAFPFAFMGNLYNTCIADDVTGEDWCYTTQKDENGEYLKGNCVCESQQTSTGLEIVTSPRAGLECKNVGLQKITTQQACEHACAGLKSRFEVVSGIANKGCTRKVTGSGLGTCQWNTNKDAPIVDPTRRPVCTDAARGTTVDGTDRSNGNIVAAPTDTTCALIKFADITSSYDCHISCLLAGEQQWQTGSWDRPAGCWVEKGTSCTWNVNRASTKDAPPSHQQLCIRPKAHYASQCLKHGVRKPGDASNCCGIPNGELRCPLGFVLEAPLLGAKCDSSICGVGFCRDHPTAGAHRCVVPDWGWQPPTFGEASCGPTRTYHGKIGLSKCVERCEFDPLCKSIFGALDKGDNSCWTCPEFTLRPATQLNDGENVDSNIATNYKAYQLKRRTKYAFVAIPNTETCPQGTTGLNEKECRAVAGAIISNAAHLPVMDNTKAAGCRLPLHPADAVAARPTWSHGSGAMDKDTKIVCKTDLPIDTLVSYNYTMFENAIVSGETASTELAVRDGSKCVDGQITTFCTSSLTSQMKKPYLQFDLKQPLMVMRLYIASRGDDHVNDLDRFSVWVEDGREDGSGWQLCKFRQEVSFSRQYNEVYCDNALYGKKIKIELGEGNKNNLQIADVVVQGIKAERWIKTNPEYEHFKDLGACRQAPAEAELKVETCLEDTIDKCASEGRKACNGNPRCFGFAIKKTLFPATITTYDKRALDEYKCSEEYGLESNDEFDFFVRSRKEVLDVICIERPCWSYNYPTGEFKHAGCTPAQLAVAEATRDSMDAARACRNVSGRTNRLACYNEQQFQRIVGRNKFETFNSKKDVTRNSCNILGRRRVDEEESDASPADARLRFRRLMTIQDTAAEQCRRRAEITNTAACNNLKEAADKSVKLYQDQKALAGRRKELLRQEAIVNGVTNYLDLVSGAYGGPEKPEEYLAVVESGSNLIQGVANDADRVAAFDQEVRLQQREAEISRIRDLSDIAAVCDARSTDDLLCQITDLRERIDENFYNVLRVAADGHRQVMEQLARQDTVLETSLITVFTIANAVEQTLSVLESVERLQIEFPQTIRDLEFLRSRYQLFAGPDGDRVFDDFSKSNADWCEMISTFADRGLYARLVRWVQSDAFLESVMPTRDRAPTEKNVWTQCEVDEWARKYTDAHRSIEILYSFANGISEYADEFKINRAREDIIRGQRADMAEAYKLHLKNITDHAVTAKRCVGDSFTCPDGYHATHVDPHPNARPEYTNLPEPVTKLPCAPNTCDCPNGKGFEGVQCQGHANLMCESCNQGYFLDNGVCRVVEPTCEFGIPESELFKLDQHDHGKTYCSSACNAGYHTEDRHDPSRGQGMDAVYVECVIDECFCDSRTGKGLMGTECTTGHLRGGRELTDAQSFSQCGSCNAGFTLVAYTSADGPRATCETDVGFRMYSERNFQGKRSTIGQLLFAEVWQDYQQTGSVVVYPGNCIGFREAANNWRHRSGLTHLNIHKEYYLCNCHQDQIEKNHAVGFDQVTIHFQGIRRFRCDDQFLNFMNPTDTPSKIYVHGSSYSPFATGLVGVEAGGVVPKVEIRRSSTYHHPLPGQPWFRGGLGTTA